MQPKIYLAGPEVFFPEPLKVAAGLKEICTAHGLIGCFPMDAQFPAEGDMSQAEAIYRADVGLVDECDAVIANMTPFRGVSMDVGTAYELGYAVAQGKPVFGWSKVFDQSYTSRVQAANIADGMMVEEYELYDNLMVVIPLHEQKVHASFADAAKAAASVLT